MSSNKKRKSISSTKRFAVMEISCNRSCVARLIRLVACNALHSVRQRLARWILTTHDRTETDRLPLTQEFLAIMLGVKRNAVSIVARDFLEIGAIEYKRGKITVINLDLLKSESCECYARIRGEISLLFSRGPSSECED